MARRRVPGVRRRPGPAHLLLSRPWLRAPLSALRQPGASAAVLVATAVLGIAAATAPLFLSVVATGALHRAVNPCPELYRPAVTNTPPGSIDDNPLPGGATAYARAEDVRVRAFLDAHGVPVAGRTLVLGQPGAVELDLRVPGRPESRLVTAFADPAALGRVDRLRGDPGRRGLWLPAELADRLRVDAGDQVTVRGRPLPVAGVYRGLDDPAYAGTLPAAWCRWSALVLPRIGDVGQAPRPLVLTDADTLLALAGTDRPWATWFAAVDPATARASDAAATAAAIRGVGSEVQYSADIVGSYEDQSSLGEAAGRAQQVRTALSGATWPAALAAVLVALLLVAAAGGYWAERRADEVRLLAARGVGPPGLAGKAVLEMLGPALLGAALGWAVTLALAPRLGPSSVLDAGAGGRALRTVALALAAGLLALGAVAGLRGRSTGERPVGLGLSRWALVPWELLLVAAAGWAWWGLHRGGAVRTGNEVVEVDPRLVAFPLLALAGLTMFAVRLLGLPAGRLHRVAAGLPVPGFLALRRLGGARAVAAVVLVAVAVPIGVLVTCASISASVAQTVHASSRQYVGAEVALVTDAAPARTPATGGRGTTVSQLPEGVAGGGDELPVLGVDPATFARYAYWRGDFAADPLPELLARLGPARDGRVPAILAGRSGPVEEVSLRSTSLAVDVVGRASGFPGMRVQASPVLVVDRRALTKVDPYTERAEEVWTDDRDDGPVAAAVVSGGQRISRRLDEGTALRNTALYPLTWTFSYVQVLAALAGVIGVTGLLLYLAARQRSRTAAYALSRRMGLTRRAHLGSLLVELTVVVGVGAVLGVLLARLVLEPVVRLLALRPGLAPILALSGPAVLGVAVGAVVLVVFGALVAQAVADRARPADVLRGAG